MMQVTEVKEPVIGREGSRRRRPVTVSGGGMTLTAEAKEFKKPAVRASTLVGDHYRKSAPVYELAVAR
jgi:hypothetical protein